MLDMIPDKLMMYIEIGMAVIAAASVCAAAIAKLTKTDKDDKIANLLKKAHDLLARIGFHPPIAEKQAGKAAVADKVYDHRSVK